MKTFTVLAPRTDASGRSDPLGVVFVKEGIAWPALFVPLLWLLYHRMWLELVGFLVLGIAIGVAGEVAGGPVPPLAALTLQVLVALEGNQLRRARLYRRGYDLVGVAAGRNLEEAEIRFFVRREATSTRPPPPAEPTTPAAGPAVPAETKDVVGLFPAPEGGTR